MASIDCNFIGLRFYVSLGKKPAEKDVSGDGGDIRPAIGTHHTASHIDHANQTGFISASERIDTDGTASEEKL